MDVDFGAYEYVCVSPYRSHPAGANSLVDIAVFVHVISSLFFVVVVVIVVVIVIVVVVVVTNSRCGALAVVSRPVIRSRLNLPNPMLLFPN